MLASVQKSKNLNDEQLPAQFSKFFQQFKNVNFLHSDQRLDPQPNGSSRLTNGSDSSLTTNGTTNGKTTCKFESKASSRGFLNCDSDKLMQYQVSNIPLSVLTKLARIANNNPDSSLMMSILTYVNTLHTFSVK